MKVLKFGGTSVGTVESLKNVKAIVENTQLPAIVVVSALGGITDKLIETARKAASGDKDAYEIVFAEIVKRHETVINGVVAPEKRSAVSTAVNEMLSELARIYLGVYYVSDLSERVLDRIVSFGERMSSTIVWGMINGMELKDSRSFIKTEKRHGKHKLDVDATNQLLSAQLSDVDKPGKLTLVQGFISTDSKGDITNLGRGGSDYTAAILAAAFNADILEIWTDVDGFLTADPRKIRGTHIIDEMSFVEAMELCNFGAKVVYPPTIYPVFHKNIPVKIKNTFNPLASGTLIADSGIKSTSKARGVSSLTNTAMLTVEFQSQSDMASGRMRILNSLARKGVDLYTTADSASNQISFIVRDSEAESAMEEIAVEFSSEINDNRINLTNPRMNVATIALVGENINENQDLYFEINKLLSDKGITPLASSTSVASGSNLTILVDLTDEPEAMQSIHDYLYN